MIRLTDAHRCSYDEVRRWAYDPDPALPVNADPNTWDLMLGKWYPEFVLYAELIADDACPKRLVFLGLLRRGVLELCRSTRWSGKTTDDLLLGVGARHPILRHKNKGGGKKEKARVRDQAARAITEAAEADARSHAGMLIEIVRGQAHPDLRELAIRLERFLADPATVADPYWEAEDLPRL